MPTLNIEGRKVKVDDSFLNLSPEDKQAAVEEIASQLGITSSAPEQPAAPKEVSGPLTQFWGGLESITERPGAGLEEFGKLTQNPSLEGAGKKLREISSVPDDYVSGSQRFFNPEEGDSLVDPLMGWSWGNFPEMAAEIAGQLTGQIAVRGAGGAAGSVAGPAGAVAGAIAAPTLLEFMSIVGPIVRQRLDADGRTEPTWEDWSAAAAAAGMSSILNTIGLKGVGGLNAGLKAAGKKTATEVGKDFAVDAGKAGIKEGATEGAQSILEQTGATAGTDKGWTLDLKRAVEEAFAGAVGGTGVRGALNAPRAGRTIRDIRAVDSAAESDPFAREKAEFTRDVNDLDNRVSQGDAELQAREVNRYVSDIRAQTEEAIRGQKLSPEDTRALIRGLKDAEGITDERLNEIAGRSESPSEIQAIARRLQVIRSLTAQQQGRKGLRGIAATAARYGGPTAGAAIGTALGTGPIEGAAIGTGVGRVIAQRLSGSQTQGNRISQLIGKTQERRANLLLDRYGPSAATQAMNKLTEAAAVKTAAAEAEAKAQQDFKETMASIRQFQALRDKTRKAEEQAKTKEEKEAARKEREKYNLAYREARLKAMALNAANSQARNQRIVQELEAKKSLNALTIEMTQVRRDLQQKTAEAKAESLDRRKQFKIADLRGRLEKLSLDIQKRQEALKKAKLSAERAAKTAERAPKSAKPTLDKIREMGTEWQPEDSGIDNEAMFKAKKEEADALRKVARDRAREDDVSEGLRTLIIDTMDDIDSAKTDMDKRRDIFEEALVAADSIQPGGRSIMREALEGFAYLYFTRSKKAKKAQAEDIPF